MRWCRAHFLIDDGREFLVRRLLIFGCRGSWCYFGSARLLSKLLLSLVCLSETLPWQSSLLGQVEYGVVLVPSGSFRCRTSSRVACSVYSGGGGSVWLGWACLLWVPPAVAPLALVMVVVEWSHGPQSLWLGLFGAG